MDIKSILKEKEIKYLHILWHNAISFDSTIVNTINNETEYFNKKDHAFIMPWKDTYEELKQHENVYLVKNCNLINKYADCAERLIVHAMNCGRIRFFFTRKKNMNKTVLRTWGHDILRYKTFAKKSIFDKMKAIIYNTYVYFYSKKCRQFRLIGVANDIDITKVHKMLGNVDTCKMPYNYGYSYTEKLDEMSTNTDKHKEIRILVGHSVAPQDKHMEIMHRLQHLSKENIRVYLVLSSADSGNEYVESVKKTAFELYGSKAVIIENRLPFEEYARFLANIDVAIMAADNSSALGNISLLATFGKKIYVSYNSDFEASFKKNGCTVYSVEVLDNINIKELVEYSDEDKQKMKKHYGRVSRGEMLSNYKKILEMILNE